MRRVLLLTIAALLVTELAPTAQRTVKPPLHGRHWVAITGKPLGATAGAMIFQKGGNAVDAACAMLGAVATMWDTLGWGGETQALIYNPKTKKVVGINALGVAPDRRHARVLSPEGDAVPARVRPARRGHPGHARRPAGDARRVRHAQPRATCSRPRLKWPTATPSRRRQPMPSSARRTKSRNGRYSKTVFLPHAGEDREAPRAGRDLQAARSRRHAAQARGRRAAGARRRQEPQGCHPRRLRPLLPGRHRAGVRPRFARARRPAHDGGPRPLEGARRRAGRSPTTRASRSTS